VAALVTAVHRGVDVTVLLEGAPTGGLTDQSKYVCQQLEAAGGQCWFMIRDDSAGIRDRYRYLHAKLMLIDGERVLIGSENLSPNSMPDDDKTDGTWGRRGVVLMTDAPGVVAHVQTVFDLDFDTANHVDLFRWQAGDADYGAPPAHFVPVTESGGMTYTVRYLQPVSFSGEFGFELVQSPENSLRPDSGLLGLVSRAGAGDTILVQQLAERPYWGTSTSNPVDDPSPRLEAYIAAARRGAAVKLLLDSFFDTSSPNSNATTCSYVNQIGKTEGLDLHCAVANPTGLGIHNKMVLAEIDGAGYVHVGSLNGSEQSMKGNRELAVQVQSDEAYALLAEMFDTDWPKRVYLPLVMMNYVPPAGYVLISEVLYDPFGADDAEFIELVNPSALPIDISNYAIGDAVNVTDFEDVRRFPAGTILPPGGTLVVANTATGFAAAFGQPPDFEIVGTNTAVPDLIDDPAWGDPAALLQLANGGDEVILRDGFDQIVDVVTYGSGSFPGVVGCALVTTANHSLERYPYWRDTDDCTADFRDWLFPNPGDLP
ncbi:MAG: lamin tail domain-containing protein, partial [Anaerolineales bacterium]|nr:lamin tail domain-containing protein [Anaerolineales bacterium]